ncbi:MAG: protein-L-isoaspartate O-methyltransferase [Candidatus Parcubacteria bacterium]|nr:MAG: protein-L-isoaspartate O-methyltransferase [Candidatus Parcubacteria bacterium]
MIQNNQELVKYLIEEKKVLKTKEIIDAFLKIDRQDFVREEYLTEAYNDYPLPIGYGQTISQPFTVAFMLELLQPQKDNKILDIGFGSGWTTCLLAEISQNKVYAIEVVPEVFEFGKKNIEKYNFFKEGVIEVFLMDGSKGFLEKAPFDRILVSAAAKKIPEELIQQLNENGVLVIPDFEGIYKIKKFNGKIEKEYYYGFIFVSLVSK